jgi:integrase
VPPRNEHRHAVSGRTVAQREKARATKADEWASWWRREMEPDSKTGRKLVYLNAPALDVLAALPHQLGNPHVICGHRDGRAYVGLGKVWRRVCCAAELFNVRLHDLHSFASIGAAGNNSLLILGKLLGHRHAATTERYAHLAADPMQRVAETIGQRISTALAGKGDASDANVMQLRGTARPDDARSAG